MQCPNCKTEVSSHLKNCPKCQNPLNYTSPPHYMTKAQNTFQSKTIYLISFFIIIALIAAFGFYFHEEDKEIRDKLKIQIDNLNAKINKLDLTILGFDEKLKKFDTDTIDRFKDLFPNIALLDATSPGGYTYLACRGGLFTVSLSSFYNLGNGKCLAKFEFVNLLGINVTDVNFDIGIFSNGKLDGTTSGKFNRISSGSVGTFNLTIDGTRELFDQFAITIRYGGIEFRR